MILDEGEDFSSNDLLLKFVSGAAPDTQCITIDIVDDMDFEESHSFYASILTITPPVAPSGEFATVVIQDNNGKLFLYSFCIYKRISFLLHILTDAVVVMVNSSQSVNEDDGSVSVCVDSGITGSAQTELLVTIAASVGSACT